jgi:hypothetical protein
MGSQHCTLGLAPASEVVCPAGSRLNGFSAAPGQADVWQAALDVEELLLKKASILSAAIAVDIDTGSRCLKSLPALLNSHLPDQCHLPMLIHSLATLEDWESPGSLAASLAQARTLHCCSHMPESCL